MLRFKNSFLVAATFLAFPLFATNPGAQGAPSRTLALPDAQALAIENNPEFRQTLSSERSAFAAQRTSIGALLPSLNASFGTSLQQGGRQVFSGAELGASSDVIQSSYSIGISYRLSGASLINPRIQRANRDAVDADISRARAALTFNVARQYLSAQQAAARAELQDSLIGTAQLQVDFARARVGAGAGIQLDIQRAEVALGQAQVSAIQAHNVADVEKLRLFQLVGVLLPVSTQLTSTFPFAEPTFYADSLVQLALRENPSIQSARDREHASALGVKRVRSEYLPTLSLGTSIGGYTYQYRDADYLVQRGRLASEGQRASCFTTDSIRVGAGLPGIASQCDLITFSPDDEARIRADNSQYPFDFTRNPGSLSASVSIPIFDGFAREQRLSEAEIARSNNAHALRAAELAIAIEVNASYLTLSSSFRAARLQEQNAAKARAEMQFALERFRVGSATFLEVSDARAMYERAEGDRINALFEFHKAIVALEAAVGRPLR